MVQPVLLKQVEIEPNPSLVWKKWINDDDGSCRKFNGTGFQIGAQ